MNQLAKLILATTLLLALNAALADEIVFDNSVHDIERGLCWTSEEEQVGDSMILDGEGRYVTSIAIWMEGLENAVADVIIRFYEGGDPDLPGDLIWEQRFYDILYGYPHQRFVVFDVPFVRVPRTFTWTVQEFNYSAIPGLPQLKFYDPPVVGRSDPEYYLGKKSAGAEWERRYPALHFPKNLGVIVTATDCPLFDFLVKLFNGKVTVPWNWIL